MTTTVSAAGRDQLERRSPEFIEALARGLDVIRAFGEHKRRLSLSEVSAASNLARPTARRVLITLADLGYVRTDGRTYALTPRVLELGTAYTASSDLWDAARDRLHQLVEDTGESCSIAQLDGSDIVYVARVAVPKLVTLSVQIGTRFPARATSLGKVLLAALSPDALESALAVQSRSSVVPTRTLDDRELRAELRQIRAQGWALTDQQLGPAIRSVAAPIRDGFGQVVAAVNVNAHAAETSVERLTEEILPLLLRTASEISVDLDLLGRLPIQISTDG